VVLPVQVLVAGLFISQPDAATDAAPSGSGTVEGEAIDPALVEAIDALLVNDSHEDEGSGAGIELAPPAEAAEPAILDVEVAPAVAEMPLTPPEGEVATDGPAPVAKLEALPAETLRRVPIAPDPAAGEAMGPADPGLDDPPDAPPGEQLEVVSSVVRSVGNATVVSSDNPVVPLLASTVVDESIDDTLATTKHGQGAPGAQTVGSAPPETAAHEATPPPEPVAARPISPVDQVADLIVERLQGDGGEARLVLDPPDLGEVIIRLHAQADHVRLEVVVERPEALQVLRDGSPSLQSLLAQRGLDLGDATFLLSHQRSQDGTGQDEQPAAQADSGFAALLGLDEPGDPTAIQKLQRLRSAYNPDGALLYRV
jgi:hypothetical protein